MHLIDDFISHISFEKRYSNHTVIAYKKDLLQFTEELEVNTLRDLNEINTKNIRNFIGDLVEFGLENTTINRKISALKSFFKYCLKNNFVDKNPTTLIKSLKTKKRLPSFVPEQQLWNNEIFNDEKTPLLNKEVEVIFEILYQTGIRVSELINLEVKNITNTQIKVLGKRNKERFIPIGNKLYITISELIDLKNIEEIPNNFLLENKSGKKRTSKFVYTKVNTYLGKATNLSKRSPHVLRHTFATHMLNNGASIESIKSLLGHADLTATQVYTHNSFKQLKSVYKQAHPRGN